MKKTLLKKILSAALAAAMGVMLLSGCNFSLLLLSLSWKSFTILRNQEFRTFLLYTLILGIGIGIVLLFGGNRSLGTAFRESFFSVISP